MTNVSESDIRRRGHLGEEDRRTETERNGHQESQERRDQRAIDERQGAEFPGHRIPGAAAEETQAELGPGKPRLPPQFHDEQDGDQEDAGSEGEGNAVRDQVARPEAQQELAHPGLSGRTRRQRGSGNASACHEISLGRPKACPAPNCLLNLRESFQLFGHHALRQRSVRKSFRHLLSGTEHPLNELYETLSLRRVLDFGGHQEPGEARDRIGGLSGAFVIETRKSSGMLAAAPAAAAVTLARSAFTNEPAALRTRP